jgi:hypothetical protein
MSTAIPTALDALVAVFKVALPGVAVYDGPSADYAGTEGAAVGASREDDAIEFELPTAGLGRNGERDVITCILWSGSGSTVFKPHRDRVNEMIGAVIAGLKTNLTLSGAVSTADVTGGVISQEQTGRGVLVIGELRVALTRF